MSGAGYEQGRTGLFEDAGKKVFSLEYIDSDDWDAYFTTLDGETVDFVGYPADPDLLLDELVTGY